MEMRHKQGAVKCYFACERVGKETFILFLTILMVSALVLSDLMPYLDEI